MPVICFQGSLEHRLSTHVAERRISLAVPSSGRVWGVSNSPHPSKLAIFTCACAEGRFRESDRWLESKQHDLRTGQQTFTPELETADNSSMVVNIPSPISISLNSEVEEIGTRRIARVGNDKVFHGLCPFRETVGQCRTGNSLYACIS
jgi:hypothetical protein